MSVKASFTLSRYSVPASLRCGHRDPPGPHRSDAGKHRIESVYTVLNRRSPESGPGDYKKKLSLVHTVPVYAPVRPGSLQPADRGEPGRIGTKFECVHIFPAVLRTRPGLGHTLITVCPGNVTICDSAFPV